MSYKLSFISNTFISNARVKLAKNQANAKQKPEAELELFENFSHSSSMLSSKNKRTYFKNVSVHEIIQLIIMKTKMEKKNISHRYNINRPRSRHGYKFSKYKTCVSMIMLIYIEQNLSNI